MAQSKPSYGVQDPKDSGKTQYQSQTPPESTPAPTSPPEEGSEVEAEPVPACRCKHVGEWEWVEKPYTESLAAQYEACEWDCCYPDGAPDPTETDVIVRSRHYPSVFHRVEYEHQPVADDEERGDHPFGPGDLDKSEPVESATEIQAGDGVAWDGLKIPLVAIEQCETTRMKAKVIVKGPSGGEYQLRARHDGRVSVAPGRGCVENVVRIVVDDLRRPCPEAV